MSPSIAWLKRNTSRSSVERQSLLFSLVSVFSLNIVHIFLCIKQRICTPLYRVFSMRFSVVLHMQVNYCFRCKVI